MIKILIVSMALLVLVSADTIHFKNGSSLTGTIESKDAQTVTLNGTKYSMSDVKNISKGTTTPPPPPPAQSTTPPPKTSTTTESDAAASTEAAGPNLVGPTGVTGTIRRTHRRIGRRDGASID